MIFVCIGLKATHNDEVDRLAEQLSKTQLEWSTVGTQTDDELFKIDKSNIKTQTEKMPSPVSAFFHPDIKSTILQLINNERKGIHGALYRFTLYDLADSLVKKSPAINVNLIVNHDYQKDFCSALRLLVENNKTIACNTQRLQGTLNRKTGELCETMHHKFVIFHKQKGGKVLVTGSFNWTGIADCNNSENITVITDKKTIKRFQKEFDTLQKYTKILKKNDLKCQVSKSEYARQMNGIPNGVNN